ncbi:MAG: hypothetical protein ACKVQJ_00590 [Pyrinomonadaceae bacterium]
MRFLTTILLFLLLSIPVLSQTQKPKTSGTKPKPATTPLKRPSEKTEWEKAVSTEDKLEQIAALKAFNEEFPKSAKRNDAFALIATVRGALGNEKLAANDLDAAIVFFKAAAADAPKSMPDQLFTDVLLKVPANLYYRGARGEALEIAKILEEKADASPGQLLALAAFYMGIESGTDAKRLAEKAIALEPNSSTAYQTLGLANRLDFQLDDSGAAFARALELSPGSMSALRGLAEMKRSLGKADEAAVVYREILAKDDVNLPAKTGLILSLFDAGKRADAETEMARSLEANAGNVILLAGAAYWYAAHSEGEKALEFAQMAIAADPRFIWSHVALARGLLVLKRPVDAEKVLLSARKYGNFPTLEYELASAKLAAGYYQEASEEMAKSFSVKDGLIQTKLGGRVTRESNNLTDLIGFERRASIFAPVAADDAENASRLTALLEFKQTLDAPAPNADLAAKSADEFIRGDDRMKVHRQIYAASQFLEKGIALSKVLELTKAASANVEAGLDIPNAAVAVTASELYDSRAIAATKGEYIDVPNVPRFTMSSILRGRIEDITGWSQYKLENTGESVIRLKRAVSVLPVNSSWWRASLWRLGSALAAAGKETEALDAYIKSYKSGGPDIVRYSVIESLYKRVNGNIDDLEVKIGSNPAPPATIAEKVEPSPAATPQASATPEGKPEPTSDPTVKDLPEAVAIPTPTPEVEKRVELAEPTPVPSPEVTPEPAKVVDEKPKAVFPPVVITVPSTEGKLETATEPKPCTITASEENLTLENGGGDLAVIIGIEGEGELDELKAVSSSPENIAIRREVVAGIKARALFVVSSVSNKAGLYQVGFELPCGKKLVMVRVR